jgi:hypothetical protein
MADPADVPGPRGLGQRRQLRLAIRQAPRRDESEILDEPHGLLLRQCAYGKLLPHETDVGRELVESGLAWAFVRYSDVYVTEENAARVAGVGVWRGMAQPPWEYRRERWAGAVDVTPRPECPIKGNISMASGERIYHTPWSPDYARTVISEDKGERWFCDEAEAIAAGWRPARAAH